jgi:hypothetical protein
MQSMTVFGAAKDLCKNNHRRSYRNSVFFYMHCTENAIYVFPEMKLRDLVPNSYIQISVNYLYIPSIGLPIWLQQNRQTDPEIHE